VLDSGDMFGQAVAEVRDLNNDGINEIMVGSVNDDDGGTNRGAVWVLFVNTSGVVTLHRKISSGLGGFTGPLVNGDMFGRALTSPRDLDGDGVADLVVGAAHDDDGGTNRGAAWVLFLDGVPGAFCGDAILDPGEDCDDGNNDPGDCCAADCSFDAATTPCLDGNVCNGDEECDGAGVCLPGTPLECDDGDLCTQDLCHPIDGCQATEGPANICFFAGRVKFDLTDKPDDTKDKLNWKWLKGEELVLSDFGSPATTTQYALCVYDGQAGTPVLERKIDIPAGSFWTPTTTKGFKYKDKTGSSDGAVNVQLKIGVAGKSKVSVQAKGVNLDPPPAEGPSLYFQQNPNVIVQLLNSDGMCWSSEFLPPAKVTRDDLFKDMFP
jgi:cysteine-rich repeat protein